MWLSAALPAGLFRAGRGGLCCRARVPVFLRGALQEFRQEVNSLACGFHLEACLSLVVLGGLHGRDRPPLDRRVALPGPPLSPPWDLRTPCPDPWELWDWVSRRPPGPALGAGGHRDTSFPALGPPELAQCCHHLAASGTSRQAGSWGAAGLTPSLPFSRGSAPRSHLKTRVWGPSSSF